MGVQRTVPCPGTETHSGEGNVNILKELHSGESWQARKTMGNSATKINDLHTVGMKKCWSGKNQIMALNWQRKRDKMMDLGMVPVG